MPTDNTFGDNSACRRDRSPQNVQHSGFKIAPATRIHTTRGSYFFRTPASIHIDSLHTNTRQLCALSTPTKSIAIYLLNAKLLLAYHLRCLTFWILWEKKEEVWKTSVRLSHTLEVEPHTHRSSAISISTSGFSALPTSTIREFNYSSHPSRCFFILLNWILRD